MNRNTSSFFYWVYYHFATFAYATVFQYATFAELSFHFATFADLAVLCDTFWIPGHCTSTSTSSACQICKKTEICPYKQIWKDPMTNCVKTNLKKSVLASFLLKATWKQYKPNILNNYSVDAQAWFSGWFHPACKANLFTCWHYRALEKSWENCVHKFRIWPTFQKYTRNYQWNCNVGSCLSTSLWFCKRVSKKLDLHLHLIETSPGPFAVARN